MRKSLSTGDKALGVISNWILTETIGNNEIVQAKLRGNKTLQQNPVELNIQRMSSRGVTTEADGEPTLNGL